MSHQVGQLGFFQISNLIRNKVPFSFLAIMNHQDLQSDLQMKWPSEIVQLWEKAHFVSDDSFLNVIADLKLPVQHPIVLVCPKGELSSRWAEILTSRGFLNVYYVSGGAGELLSPKDAQ